MRKNTTDSSVHIEKMILADRSRTMQFSDALLARDDDAICHPGEDSGIDDAGHSFQLLFERGGVVYASVIPVHDVVTIVGNKRAAVAFAHVSNSAQRLQEQQNAGHCKGNHLNWNNRPLAQPVDELAFVNNDDNAVGCMSHDLLADEGPTEALDQIQFRRYFVGTIDGYVNAGMLLQRCQPNTGFLRQLARIFGSGYPAYFQSRPAELADEVRSR